VSALFAHAVNDGVPRNAVKEVCHRATQNSFRSRSHTDRQRLAVRYAFRSRPETPSPRRLLR